MKRILKNMFAIVRKTEQTGSAGRPERPNPTPLLEVRNQVKAGSYDPVKPMFATLLKNVSGRTSSRIASPGRRSKPRRRPQVEALEDRVLLSSAPFVYDQLHIAGHTLATAQSVNLMPMMQSQADIAAAGTQDFYKITLQKGEIFTADDRATIRLFHNSPRPAARPD
jgi:hypothetical protein